MDTTGIGKEENNGQPVPSPHSDEPIGKDSTNEATSAKEDEVNEPMTTPSDSGSNDPDDGGSSGPDGGSPS